MVKDGNNIYYLPATPKIIIDGAGTVYHGGGKFQPETLAIFARSRAAGFNTPDIFFMRKVDIIIYNLKLSGVWYKLDAFFWFGYQTTTFMNFRTINWKNPTGALGVIGGGVTIEAYGLKGNAMNGYFDTGFVPSVNGVNYTLNSAHVGILEYTEHTTSQVICSAGNLITWNAGGQTGQRLNSTNNLTEARGRANIEYKVMSRNNSATTDFYYKDLQSVSNQASTAIPTDAIRFLISASIYSLLGMSVISVGGALTNSEYQLQRAIINNGLALFGLNPIA